MLRFELEHAMEMLRESLGADFDKLDATAKRRLAAFASKAAGEIGAIMKGNPEKAAAMMAKLRTQAKEEA